MITDSRCTKVNAGRWAQAQAWERNQWIATEKVRARYGKNFIWPWLSALGLKPRDRGDDGNVWWAEKFDHYAFLPPDVENAIELGCGPYTNMRLIQRRCAIRHLVLSDPLIKTYVRFPLTYVSRSYREVCCMLDDHPIEDCPFVTGFFDLVVMTNVLDHVRDADACMENVIRITKPGGILIVGQELTDEQDVKALENSPGGIGHPIRVDHHWMDRHLTRFTAVRKTVLPRDKGRGPACHYGTYLFAGRKRLA